MNENINRAAQQPQQNNQINPENQPKTKQKYAPCLAISIILFLFEYYIFMYEIIWNNINIHNKNLMVSLIIFFNFIIILIIWSYIMTKIVHPGDIPVLYGFHIGEIDKRGRRYCLICNILKPERTHHCVHCNTCTPCMDHHSLWHNNCIGFYNRKFFTQNIFYSFLLLLFLLFTETYYVYYEFYYIFHGTLKHYMRAISIIVAYLIVLLYTFANMAFSNFLNGR
jgi:hypothetical protein